MSTHGPADPWNEETVNQDPVSAAPQQPSAESSAAPSAPETPVSQTPHQSQPVPPAQSAPPVQSAPPAQSMPPMYQPGYSTYQPRQYEPQYEQQYQQYPPQYQAPTYGQAQYEPQYAQPKKTSTAIIVLSVLLALVVLIGAGLGIYLWRTRAAATPPPPVPAVNECLVSNGDTANPMLTPVGCGPNTYKVLKVQRGTTDSAVCNGVGGVSDTYKFEWPVDPTVNNYVLCLQKQTQ
jgi:hypothetical protein